MAHVLTLPEGKWADLDVYSELASPADRKRVLIVRYGGFGDMMMASSLFQPLRDQGWHITVNTQGQGVEVLKHDPRIDRILAQRRNQVPNLELGQYIEKLSESFDKVVNLSESVETNLLAVGPRFEEINGENVWVQAQPAFGWSHEKRHFHLNRNYVEETHRIADVPFVRSDVRFMPSKREVNQAHRDLEKFKKKAGVSTVILWSLSGSSLHKAYLWQDNVIAAIMGATNHIGFILVGDGFCKLLEQGWEKEKRIWRRSGEWSIRRTLTMAQNADVVMGPETGVLNAVSMENVKKIVHLSHSSPENLTRDWLNTTVLTADVPCYPCHQMHYSRCDNIEPESTMPLCSSGIRPSEFVEALIDHERQRVCLGTGSVDQSCLLS